MLNPPNSLSFLRAPLALLLLIENAALRTCIILLAMLTDCVDGYLARRYRYTSRFGAILDPLMDKFFVYVALAILFYEHRLSVWLALAMLSRDGALIAYLIYLGAKGQRDTFIFKPIRWGKVTTAAQFCFLIALFLKLRVPSFLFFSFVIFGALAFAELVRSPALLPRKNPVSSR